MSTLSMIDTSKPITMDAAMLHIGYIKDAGMVETAKKMNMPQLLNVMAAIEDAPRLQIDNTAGFLAWLQTNDWGAKVEELLQSLAISEEGLPMLSSEIRFDQFEQLVADIQGTEFGTQFSEALKAWAEFKPSNVFFDGIERVDDEIASSPSAILAVPEKLRTPELWIRAVGRRGRLLKDVPVAQRSAEICLAAIRNDPYAFDHVPQELMTYEFCCEVAKRDWMGVLFRRIPVQMRTPELLRFAVTSCGWLLEEIPLQCHSEELYDLAIQSKGQAIMFVPEELRTPERCLASVKSDPKAIAHLSPDQITHEICWLVVPQSGDALMFVPEALRTKELIRAAIKTYGSALMDLSVEDQSEDLCIEAMETAPFLIRRLNPEKLTPAVIMAAVKANGRVIEEIKPVDRTEEICVQAVSSNQSAMEFVPDAHRQAAFQALATKLGGRVAA